MGKPATRQDGLLRTSGAARYTVDVALPGMLHARVLRAPVARCRVTSLDLDAARAVPGVRAVIGPDGPFTMGGDPILTSEPGWAGEPIAAVAADTVDAAAAGLAALAPVLEELPPLDLDGGLDQQRFTEEPREVVRGDPDGALAQADVRIELTCETPAHVQTPLEPHAAVARWDGDSLTAWVSTQGMFDARRDLARRFGLRAGARPGDLGVHRRRVRRQAGRGGRGRARRRARACRRATGSTLPQPAGGPDRRRSTGPHAPDGDARRLPRGVARRDRARRRRRHGRGRLDLPRRRARAVALRMPERPRDDLPREDESSGPERIPRAGRGRGDHRPRAGDRRARSRPRDRPAGAPAPEPRRARPGIRAAVLEQAPARVLRPRGGARRLEPARRPSGGKRRRAPARDGLRDPDLVGRRRTACARDHPARLRRPRARHDRNPGHRHRDADLGAGSSPPRSSACRSITSSHAAATRPRTSTGPSPAAR